MAVSSATLRGPWRCCSSCGRAVSDRDSASRKQPLTKHTIGELARDVGVDNTCLARMLRLTLLAPDLLEAILAGTEPDGLSLEKLYRVPMEWEEQRRALGVG